MIIYREGVVYPCNTVVLIQTSSYTIIWLYRYTVVESRFHGTFDAVNDTHQDDLAELTVHSPSTPAEI